jgi:flagellar biosynthetic protein FlhB
MSGERTEKATGKRRSEARNRGQVARSQEVNSTMVLAATFGALAVTAPAIGERLRLVFVETMARIARPDLTTETVGSLFLGWTHTVAVLLAPFFVAAATAGVLASVVQNKPGVHLQTLKPDLRRLSLLSGLKRMVGPQSLVELLKSFIKIGVIGGVAVVVLLPQLDRLIALGSEPPAAIGDYTGSLIMRLAFSVVAILVPLAVADVIFQRWQHERSLRMTKDEVKQEARQQELAPEVKGAIRRRAMEMSRQRQLADVPTADVIVTNPTHFAVALRYGKGVAAPRVVAKGADLIAARIREIAREHDVSIVENPPLARALYASVEVGDEIPAEFFGAVAEVLAFVFRTSRRALSWM